MTKAELIEALKDLPDDTVIYVPSEEYYDHTVVAEKIVIWGDGKDGDPEVKIVGDGFEY